LQPGGDWQVHLEGHLLYLLGINVDFFAFWYPFFSGEYFNQLYCGFGLNWRGLFLRESCGVLILLNFVILVLCFVFFIIYVFCLVLVLISFQLLIALVALMVIFRTFEGEVALLYLQVFPF
jgi:hypothetical protein